MRLLASGILNSLLQIPVIFRHSTRLHSSFKHFPYSTSPKFSSALTMFCEQSSTACADLYLVPMFSDNYGFVMIDRETKLTAVVDPADSEPVIKTLQSMREEGRCVPSMLLCTHKHADHAGGNAPFAATFPEARIVSTKYEETPAATELVGEGDVLTLGSLTIRVIYTPCHTAGHVVYYVTGPAGSPILFSGKIR